MYCVKSPLLASLMLSNAIHLSSWLEQPVPLPIDQVLFLSKLNKRRVRSRIKAGQDITFMTDHSRSGQAL